ncbi:phosphoglycerol transferase MdoB-like AlkP superfamily enzyme [Chryseomicrobium aureum]|uniref:small multi-drug export protein n=1 Tax=Chryseomicrobium aureum TaxID=1441723 RepID=UPI001EF80E8B|nr:small multi-drug export protein [Chryseomicrobium aureum]MBM7707130.1 phosphoglycerol transferase MdoB-like AlkP superfamily enzyme [Chryseomicrobium aureum]
MIFIFEYFLVFLGAAIPWLEMGLVIPVGILSGLDPFLVTIVAVVGNLLTVFLLIIGYEKLQVWLASRRKSKPVANSKRSNRAMQLWKKYGLPGMIMLGPILIGTHVAAFIALLVGGTKGHTTLWSIISIVLWGLAFAFATALGVDIFGRII